MFSYKHTLQITGLMPERALLRLKREKIALYNVQKTQKNVVVFSVERKDLQKVFAIYPKVCYNIDEYTPFTLTDLGAEGMGKVLQTLKNRVGLLVGTLLFCALTLFSTEAVLGVECVGSTVYQREVLSTLETYGVQPFRPYAAKNADLICSKLLSLDGVEFCSVKKRGFFVQVELRQSPFAKDTVIKGDMCSTRQGVLRSVTVLRGTAVKKAGDSVAVGDRLVCGYFLTESGEQVSVNVVARASIACTYECEVAAEDERAAFAEAYLQIHPSGLDEITAWSVSQTEGGYAVKIEYVAVQTFNF